MAFPTDWKYRLAVTIKKEEVGTNLSDFTLVLDGSFDDVLTSVNGPLDADGTRPSLDGGGDVRFTSDEAGETRLAVDIRTWETNNDPAEGKLEVAVKVSSVSSSSDTTVYLWWGKAGESQPAVDTDYGQHAAYDASYKGVYPLDDGDDRTSNQNHMTPINSPTLGADGAIGGCFESDGSNRYLRRTEAIVTPGELTISGLFRAASDDAAQDLASLGDSNAGGRTWRCSLGRAGVTGALQAGKQGLATQWSSSNDFLKETWRHAAVRLSNTNCQSFLNGTGDTNNSSALAPADMNRTTIGAVIFNGSLYAPMDGKIDEVRFSDVLRSVDWLSAEYANLLTPGDFFTFGTIVDVDADEASTIELPLIQAII